MGNGGLAIACDGNDVELPALAQPARKQAAGHHGIIGDDDGLVPARRSGEGPLQPLRPLGLATLG